MDDLFFVKTTGDEYIRLFLSDILYIVADGEHTSCIVGAEKKIIIPESLENIERCLPADLFCRIHKLYIISLRKTDSFNTTTAIIANKKIPIGKKYWSGLRCRVIVFGDKQNHFPNIKLSDFDIFRLFKNRGPN
jgi:DNA-binding LytR/AlgR family response regulator